MEENIFFWVFLPLFAAALASASFSLGVSMLTLLSGHLLSEENSAKKLTKLSIFYIFGSVFALFALLLAAIFILANLSFSADQKFWSILSGVAVGVGLCVILFYYRWSKKSGTRIWLPRRAAKFLYARTKATRNVFEAFILGIGAIFAELIFIAAPLLISANLIIQLKNPAQFFAVIFYVLVSIFPLLILFFENSRGKKISAFQKWREKSKRFLQISAGAILIILGFYLFIYKII